MGAHLTPPAAGSYRDYRVLVQIFILVTQGPVFDHPPSRRLPEKAACSLEKKAKAFTRPEDPQQLRGTPGAIRSHPRLVTRSRYWHLAESFFSSCFVLKLF